MRVFLIITCAVGICLLGVQAKNERKDVRSQVGTQEEAKRLWEQAIAAKGGRERLYAVRNILSMTTGRNYRDAGLYAFPDKVWSWSDGEPFGRIAEMVNLDRNLGYDLSGESPVRTMNERWRRGEAILIRDIQLYYLLETQWVKPVPIGVRNGKVGSQMADIVQTLIDNERVDFYFDQKSHLPLKVARISKDKIDLGKEYYWITFSDYTLVNGIQMPQRENGMDTANLPVSIQINVEYDEGIFEKPPSIEAGPDAWRVKHR